MNTFETSFPTLEELRDYNPLLTNPIKDCEKGKILSIERVPKEPTKIINSRKAAFRRKGEYSPITEEDLKSIRRSINSSRNLYYRSFDNVKCIGRLLGGLSSVWESIIRDIDYYGVSTTNPDDESSYKISIKNFFSYMEEGRENMIRIYNEMEERLGSDDIYFHLISLEYFKYLIRKSLFWLIGKIDYSPVIFRRLYKLKDEWSKEQYEFIDPCPYYDIIREVDSAGGYDDYRDKWISNLRELNDALTARLKRANNKIHELENHKLKLYGELSKANSTIENYDMLEEMLKRHGINKLVADNETISREKMRNARLEARIGLLKNDIDKLNERIKSLEDQLDASRKLQIQLMTQNDPANFVRVRMLYERLTRSELIDDEASAVEAVSKLMVRLSESDRTKLMDDLIGMEDNGSVPLVFLFKVLKKLGKDIALVDKL